MTSADLVPVGEVVDDAFVDVIAKLSGRVVPRPMFNPQGLALRLANDSAGCFVAVEDGRLLGALFSVRRGSLGWFGPVGVATAAQGRGVGRALVHECVNSWTGSEVGLMALETFPNSAYHVHFYSEFGFQPGWLGIEMRKQLGAASFPSGVEEGVREPPALDFLYPGLDLSREVANTERLGAGRVFSAGGGLGILHLTGALHTSDKGAFIPFLAAPDKASFTTLVAACEAAALEAGKTEIAVRLCGSSRGPLETLPALGYRAGMAMVRMKRGTALDFDRDAWYCDDWL